VVVLICFPRQESCALIRYRPPKLGHCARALDDLGWAAGLARRRLQPALPQCVLDDLVCTRLSSLLNCVGLVTAQLDIAEMQQVAEIGTSLGCCLECGCGCGCLLRLFTCILSFDVESAEERVGLGFGSIAEVTIEVTKGVGAGEIGVGDANTGELEEAFEELWESERQGMRTIRVTYSELDVGISNRGVSPLDLVDFSLLSDLGNLVGQVLGLLCRCRRLLGGSGLVDDGLNDFLNNGLGNCLNNLLDNFLDNRCLGGLGTRDRAVRHEVKGLLVLVLLDHSSSLECGRGWVHDRLGCSRHNRLNQFLHQLFILLDRLKGLHLRRRLEDLDELLGAGELGEGEGKIAVLSTGQLDLLDPGGARVDAAVGQGSEVHGEACLLEGVDLGDGLGEGAAQLVRVGCAGVEAEAERVSGVLGSAGCG
jgi:hypothetical protein